MITYNCIIIPGGGLLEDGSLPPWVIARLERALELINQTEWIATLSGGTVHKPPPHNRDGFPLYESRQAAAYLAISGADPGMLLTEINSYDTIGNAYFSRLLFATPFNFERLHIITSAFHLPRTEAIFNWIYSLAPLENDYKLSFEGVPDTGLADGALQARVLREKESLEKLQGKIKNITSLEVFHRWLYSKHAAYAPNQKKEKLTKDELDSY